jgi:hypothetical protein
MILIKELRIRRFRNLSDIGLKNLRDLNILIGPNNCGKTNVLEFLDLFSRLAHGVTFEYLCKDCQRLMSVSQKGLRLAGSVEAVYLALGPQDYYMKKPPKNEDVRIDLLFDRESVEILVPGLIGKQNEPPRRGCSQAEDCISLMNKNSGLFAVHFSPFLHPDVLDEIKRTLYCPELRLQQYKGKNFADFLRDKNFSGAQMRRLVDLVGKVVDPKIQDYKSQDLVRTTNGIDLDVTIAEQGSGVRSMLCLAADILADTKSRIVIVDEPELGLNPLARQELLKFLASVAEDKQVFMSTQDPCFLNPVLWRNEKDRVSVQLFSLQTEDFVNVDLHQNEEDPSVFAGYLPHTTSLRGIHIYVEGSSDVYIFQVWLRRFLKEYEDRLGKFIEEKLPNSRFVPHCPPYGFSDRFEGENRTGVFHLCGDFWPHLLYTVPKKPYTCVVVLDGNKREQVPKIVEKHNEFAANTSKFKFASSIEEVASAIRDAEYHPIYCLQKNNIEGYLGLPSLPSGYAKKSDGPRAAESQEALPEEISKLLFSVFEGAESHS